MAIATLDVNGLRGNRDEVKLLLKSLRIQILALIEAKMDRLVAKELTDIRDTNIFALTELAMEEGSQSMSGTQPRRITVAMYPLRSLASLC